MDISSSEGQIRRSMTSTRRSVYSHINVEPDCLGEDVPEHRSLYYRSILMTKDLRKPKRNLRATFETGKVTICRSAGYQVFG